MTRRIDTHPLNTPGRDGPRPTRVKCEWGTNVLTVGPRVDEGVLLYLDVNDNRPADATHVTRTFLVTHTYTEVPWNALAIGSVFGARGYVAHVWEIPG